MLVSADRLISVARPLDYKAKMTKRLARILMVIPWVIGLLLYGPVSVIWEDFHPEHSLIPGFCYSSFINSVWYTLTGSAIDFISPYFLSVLFNLIIYVNIRKRSKKIASVAGNNASNSNSRLKRDRRTARSLTLLTGVYGASWIPFVTMAICLTLGFQISQFAIDFTCFFMIANSAVNPVIYPAMQPNFRKTFIEIINRICKCAHKRVAEVSPQQLDNFPPNNEVICLSVLSAPSPSGDRQS